MHIEREKRNQQNIRRKRRIDKLKTSFFFSIKLARQRERKKEIQRNAKLLFGMKLKLMPMTLIITCHMKKSTLVFFLFTMLMTLAKMTKLKQ